MEEIIKRVILGRIKDGPGVLFDTSIQLSATMMSYLIDDLNRWTLGSKIIHAEMNQEFTYAMGGFLWKIRSNAYREDSNDGDVEMAICKFLTILNK